jgi:hypothetical protein
VGPVPLGDIITPTARPSEIRLATFREGPILRNQSLRIGWGKIQYVPWLSTSEVDSLHLVSEFACEPDLHRAHLVQEAVSSLEMLMRPDLQPGCRGLRGLRVQRVLRGSRRAAKSCARAEASDAIRIAATMVVVRIRRAWVWARAFTCHVRHTIETGEVLRV